MKTIGIPYSKDMILAKLAGRKTQTRRVIKPQPDHDTPRWSSAEKDCDGHSGRGWYCSEEDYPDEGSYFYRPPRGYIGDHQYWQEAFAFNAAESDFTSNEPFALIRYAADQKVVPVKITEREAILIRKWKPSRHDVWRGMPAMFMLPSLSRGMDEVTDLRGERVRDITEQDAIAEGATKWDMQATGEFRTENGRRQMKVVARPSEAGTYKLGFRFLWESINSERGYGWNENPWVWAYTGKRIK